MAQAQSLAEDTAMDFTMSDTARLLPGLQIDLASALGRRRFRGGNDVVPADLSTVDGLHDEQQGQDLRDAGRRRGPRGRSFSKSTVPVAMSSSTALWPFPSSAA